MQATENNDITNRDYLIFFHSYLSGLSKETSVRYKRTISAIDNFITSHRLSLASISTSMTADWATELLRQGLAWSTVCRHLNILSALLGAASRHGLPAPSSETTRTITNTTALSKSTPPLLHGNVADRCFGRLRRMASGADTTDIYTDILLFSLLNGAMPLRQAAIAKKSDLSLYSQSSRYIAERNISPSRAYIFELGQSRLTPRQIDRAIEKGLSPLLESLLPGSSQDLGATVRSIWATLALRSGSTASQALANLGGDAPLTIPAFCTPASPRDMDKSTLFNDAVATLLLHDAPSWHAMHLRRGVSFDDLRKEIEEKVRPRPELFYPSETIARQKENRKVTEQHPVISRIAFFKARNEEIAPMFSQIGSKAWCYRITSSPGAPYATISQEEMGRFQGAIGIFTPDMEIHPIGQLTPRPGESVIIIKAGYGNRQAEVENIINTDSGSAIFRVKFTTDRGYEWRADIDPRQIEKIINN